MYEDMAAPKGWSPMKSLKITRAGCLGLLAVLLMASADVVTAGDYLYSTNTDGTITITNYTGSGADISIPSTINGLSVSSIGGYYSPDWWIGWIGAFENCTNLTNVTIPNSVTNIGARVFENCTSLTNVITGNSVSYIGVGAFQLLYQPDQHHDPQQSH